jgi:hypothetical protein
MDEIPQKGTTWMEPMNLVLLLVKDNPNSVEKDLRHKYIPKIRVLY